MFHSRTPAVLRLVLLAGSLSLVGCDSVSLNNDASLIGVWELTSQNGQPTPEGIFVGWVLTATTVRVTSDLDCEEVFTYSSAGGTLTGLSVISREGSQCGDDDGVMELGPYSVDGNTLTVTTTDPEVEPTTIVSVFTRAS